MCAEFVVRQKKRHKYALKQQKQQEQKQQAQQQQQISVEVLATYENQSGQQEQQQQQCTCHKWQQCSKSSTSLTKLTKTPPPTTTRRKTKTTTQPHRAGIKWKIIISTIILLLCRISHVLAVRKGRLMSPSSFTALSGDLHVQIQFSGEDVANAINAGGGSGGPVLGDVSGGGGNGGGGIFETTISSSSTTTTSHSTTTARTTRTQQQAGSNNNNNGSFAPHMEQTIMSTLVISKYIDDDYTLPAAAANATQFIDSSAEHETLQSVTADGKVLQRRRKEVLQNIPLFPDPRHNVTQIAVPCQTFTRGGLYEMQVVTNLKTTVPVPAAAGSNGSGTTEPMPTMTTTTLMPVVDERLRQTLDVRWPSADMQVTPVRLRTYPDSPVEVTLRFPDVHCDRVWHNAGIDLPDFWLELIYCGKERTCTQLPPQNISKSNILYAEQVRGYPKHKIVKLKCELFGLAGNYAVQLRPMVPAPNVPITRRFLSVDWSDKFVFNVYARSIFPCDPHTGIGVLYEYPGCILEQGDRVRVYAKLRADVASLKPPTTLHYVAEQRVVKSQHSLYFSCDLFTEKYVEYCFVYVSQAISGAVADVRMDCVPTLPVSESDTGGWGPWSEWTPCSTNCLGGTRNRYRFCDSPPPRYGAKFCEGPSVETEKCGKSIADTWDCIYESSGTTFTKANRTEVSQEIGPGCRCGCIVHLGSSKPKRILAGATQSCPGRSFWLIQVDGEETIALTLNFLRLPCPAQYIKVRDGPSLSSTLLIELNGGSNLNALPTQIESTGAQLLLEFYAGADDGAPTNANANANGNGISVAAAANKQQQEEQQMTNSNATSGADATAAGMASSSETSINAACTGGFLANVEQIAARNASSTLLAAATRLSVKSRAVLQKTPKMRSRFTLVHLSAVIFASIIILISAMLGAQYMVRYRKYHLAIARRRDEGSRLHTPRASMSSLHGPPSRAMSTTTLLSEVIYLVKMRPKHQLRHSILRESVDAEQLARETEFNDCDAQTRMIKCDEERASSDSMVTLRNEIISPITETLSHSASLDELGSPVAAVKNGSLNGTLTRKDSGKDSESIISSGMSSICYSPPTNSKRFSKYSERYDAVTLKVRGSRLEESVLSDQDSLRSSKDYERLSQLGSRCASASLTNGCYSPAVSIVSTATIRTTNPKESKEKQNRKKLLARPGSEFSLGNQEELELDYYDYNVINAGAAPGSYLGMDPAHLIWIPPFDDMPDGIREEDDKTPEPEPDETEPLYEEIKMPKYGHYLSARSNTDSSTNNTTNSNTTPSSSEEFSPLGSRLHSKATTPSSANASDLNLRLQQAHAKAVVKQPTPYMTRKQRRQAKQQSKSTLSLVHGAKEVIPLQQLSGTKSARSVRQPELEQLTRGSTPEVDAMTGSYVEKETVVEKKTTPDLQNFLALDDIQFADESESDPEAIKQKVLGEREHKRERDKMGLLLAKSTRRNDKMDRKRASADSVLLEKREIVRRDLAGGRVETNV